MKELEQFKKYILSESSESAKDHFVFPLFQKLFPKKFKKQSDAEGADIYIEGKLLIELKTKKDNLFEGFFQALHYEKKGLSFSSICVIAYKFICIWKVNKIPDFAKKLASEADSLKAPNVIGKELAKKIKKPQYNDIIKTASFSFQSSDFEGLFEKDIDVALSEFVNVLKNLESERIQISAHNFINTIEQLKEFFEEPIDAVHCFYSIVGFWDITSTVAIGEHDEPVRVIGYKGSKYSEPLTLKPKHYYDFKKFIESRYIFTNEGSGLTVDYYFSRFDEAITKIRPEYTKQHGIFFTDHNLSKFALWFVHEFYEKKLSEKYVVLDPAGGSGNLIMSWKGHLKHKIICELQPDLLKMIERRMKLDPDPLGFTVVPKTSKNEGLNFLDKPAEKYLYILNNELKEKNLLIDKPLAFLLNPPYKNTDENVSKREFAKSQYDIDNSITELTGDDAGKERYLAFLGQIMNISRLQMGDLKPVQAKLDDIELPQPIDKKKVKEKPLLLIFTPTSWLIPRPTYVRFRKVFDKYFKYEKGFIITGSEFFKIQGRFPISFTIWSYNYNEKGNKNNILVRDLTHLKSNDLNINWNLPDEFIDKQLKGIWKKSNDIRFDNSRGEIRENIPLILNIKTNKKVKQTRLNLYRNKQREEFQKNIISGFPLKDLRHKKLKDPHGFVDGSFIGLMDDNTPIRIRQDNYNRLSCKPDRVWFRLDISLADVNKSKCQNAPPNVKGYSAYDYETSISLFTWFAITKAINGRYPTWANQYDIWAPNIKKEKAKYFYSLCFAFVLAENRCVVTKFEKDNPIEGAPEVFVDNPLCPTNSESFWSTTLDKEILKRPQDNLALQLVNLIKQLYKLWNKKYCKGEYLKYVGLQDEPYFKYFDYPDFLTPYSGLIQIKKYAELKNLPDINDLIKQITAKSKKVRDEIFKILVKDFKYFE